MRAGQAAPLSTGDVAAGRRLFAVGTYDRLGRVLPTLLAGARHSAVASSPGVARAAGVWVLASQLAVKRVRTEAAGVYASRAAAAARRSREAVELATAARAAATPPHGARHGPAITRTCHLATREPEEGHAVRPARPRRGARSPAGACRRTPRPACTAGLCALLRPARPAVAS